VFEIPTYDNVEAFVNRLAREGLLVGDPVVSAVLRGRQTGVSGDPSNVESGERRSHARHDQAIKRGERGCELLDQGATILDAVMQAATPTRRTSPAR